MEDINNNSNIEYPGDILILVNKNYYLSPDYVPANLIKPKVNWAKNSNITSRLMRQEAAKALEVLVSEASKQGIELYCVSAYRSYEKQKVLYERVKKRRGKEYANKYCALPGHSEHQTGLCIDIANINNKLNTVLGKAKEGLWLKKNAHIYGFILRYPEEKSDITGYNYEPWHFRYVGIEAATEIYNKGLTLEQYLGKI